LSQTSFLPERAIGEFFADVTIEEIATDSLEITQHPVQQGASITDHAYSLPAIVSVLAQFSDESMPLPELYAKIRKMQTDRIPVDVITGKRYYKNMLVKSLSQLTDRYAENILEVRFDLQEVFLVAVTAASVPPAKNHAAPATTGPVTPAGGKSPQAATPSQSRSALSALAGP